jgi:putative heme transporter
MGRIASVAAGLAVVVATFFFVLPRIADYRDVWAVVRELSWGWFAALLAATALNIVTFAPPWQVALPGLRFLPALTMSQASAALSIVLPGGGAPGIAGSVAMLRAWGFPAAVVARAVTLTSIWNQFANLAYPIVGVFMLSVTGEPTAAVATAAFIGVAILGVAVAALGLALSSARMARDIGDLANRATSWVRSRIRRGPVGWGGDSFARFRRGALDLLRRRWHVLTLATLVGGLCVFLVLLVSLRALDVPSSQVSAVEAFAAWALVRLIGSIPITPGGIGVVELGLTAALVGFGGNNAGVVAAVLVFRFLTIVPTVALGLVAAATWRRHHPMEARGGP